MEPYEIILGKKVRVAEWVSFETYDAVCKERDQKWIKCSDRTPDDGKFKLICRWCGPTPIIEPARFVTKGSADEYGETSGWWYGASELPNVTHWMPLPGPPTA